MFTRAIIEDVIDETHVRVRIPLTDRVKASNINTKTTELNIATMCTSPGVKIVPRVGDAVFVTYEESAIETKMVVVGYLFRTEETKSLCELRPDYLSVYTKCDLPTDTTIGEIGYPELMRLSGVRGNIQKQLDDISERLNDILESVKNSGKSEDENNE